MGTMNRRSRRAWSYVAVAAIVAGAYAALLSASAAGAVAPATGAGRSRTVRAPDIPTAFGRLAAVAVVSSADVWAAGTDSHVYPPQPLMLHWDGTRWHTTPTPETNGHYVQVRGIAAISAHDVWAVGDSDQLPLTMHWDGVAWRVVPNPAMPRLSGYTLQAVAAISARDVWAVGTGYGGTTTLAEHWSGARWSIIPTPVLGKSPELIQTQSRYSGGLAGIASISGREVWSVGFAFNDTAPLVERWDGAAWARVPSPVQPVPARSALAAIAAISPTDLWAVGRLDATYRRGGIKPLLQHWDGAHWCAVAGAPLPNDQGYSSLAGIAAIAANDIWVVGSIGFAALPLIEHWNGRRWQSVASPALPKATGQQTYALSAVAAITSADVWAVGTSSNGSTGEQPLIERWDGLRWRIIAIAATP